MTAGPGDGPPDVSLAERIAAAVGACPAVARVGTGRVGEMATYLPGRRVAGVAVRDEAVEVSVVGSATATAKDLLDQVRAAAGPLLAGRRLDVAFADIELPEPAGSSAPVP